MRRQRGVWGAGGAGQLGAVSLSCLRVWRTLSPCQQGQRDPLGVWARASHGIPGFCLAAPRGHLTSRPPSSRLEGIQPQCESRESQGTATTKRGSVPSVREGWPFEPIELSPFWPCPNAVHLWVDRVLSSKRKKKTRQAGYVPFREPPLSAFQHGRQADLLERFEAE